MLQLRKRAYRAMEKGKYKKMFVKYCMHMSQCVYITIQGLDYTHGNNFYLRKNVALLRKTELNDLSLAL